jgi:hypothetical protein
MGLCVVLAVCVRSVYCVRMETERTGWCGTCRRSAVVEDIQTEVQHTRRGELHHRVEYLACGHTACVELGIDGPSPGAPYAPDTWPNVKAARKLSPEPVGE